MICLFGGTFDPIHRGHIHGGQMVCDVLALRKIHFVLSGMPSHRTSPETTVEQRWEMLKLACTDDVRLVPDDREVSHGGPSYTVDTLRAVREAHPGEAVAWVLGSDAYAEFSSWRSWREILDLANLVVLERPGEERQLGEDMRRLTERRRVDRKPEDLAGKVFFLAHEMRAVSASGIRARISSGKVVDHLLPPRVNTYICEHGLYGGIRES
ncbi:MAG: nicotinate-nucleotide adenylyltransferase [Gammaproteobacteria bacterium]|nr:nicotinate-nucleotide adenylyltransferase [Gammaproteobacteria bacterium]